MTGCCRQPSQSPHTCCTAALRTPGRRGCLPCCGGAPPGWCPGRRTCCIEWPLLEPRISHVGDDALAVRACPSFADGSSFLRRSPWRLGRSRRPLPCHPGGRQPSSTPPAWCRIHNSTFEGWSWRRPAALGGRQECASRRCLPINTMQSVTLLTSPRSIASRRSALSRSHSAQRLVSVGMPSGVSTCTPGGSASLRGLRGARWESRAGTWWCTRACHRPAGTA